MLIAGSVGLLGVVKGDGRAFAFNRCRREATKHHFFFKGAVRRLLLEDFRVLVLVPVVLKAKKGVESGLQLFS